MRQALAGHGDTEEDSHDALPASRHGMDRLGSVEIAPFRAAISANVASAGGAPARPRDGSRGAPAGVVQRTVRDVPSKELEVRGRRCHDGRHGDGGAAGDTVAGSRGRGGGPFESGSGAESRDGGASRGDRPVPRVSHQAAAAGRHRSADDRHRRDESAAAKAGKARRRLDALCAAYVSAAPPGEFGTPGPTTSVDAVKGTATVAAAMGEPGEVVARRIDFRDDIKGGVKAAAAAPPSKRVSNERTVSLRR